MTYLKLDNVSFEYLKGKPVLKDLTLEFEPGKVYAIVGPSGSGKTTILSLLAGLNKPTSGDLLLEGKSLKNENMYHFRRKDLGVVFQNFNLLPHLSAYENVELSLDASGKKGIDKLSHIIQLLKDVGIRHEDMDKRILKLSGGEQQRVSIARAMSYDPNIILADEPTGNLDSKNQHAILAIFKKLAHDKGKCVILVTHSKEVTQQADVVYSIEKL